MKSAGQTDQWQPQKILNKQAASWRGGGGGGFVPSGLTHEALGRVDGATLPPAAHS